MSSLRVWKALLIVCALLLVSGCATENMAPDAAADDAGAAMGNLITGEGFPNPAPNVTQNWGTLPEGREWARPPGSTSIPTTVTSGRMSAAARATFGAGRAHQLRQQSGGPHLQVRPEHG